jgi:VWFA-related protein
MHLALALLGAAATQQTPTFAVGVEAVYVDVFVTDRHGPVTGLTASDFALRDDGVLRRVELVAREDQPLTTLVVLDTSGSINREKLDALRAACRGLLQALQGQPVGLMTFGNEVRLRVPPTTDSALVERELSAMSILSLGGATALYDALYAAALQQLIHGRSLIVLLSDGEDNLSWFDRARVQRVLDGARVMLQAVGVVPGGGGAPSDAVPTSRYLDASAAVSFDRGGAGEPVQIRNLRLLAESTGGRFWSASAPDKLAAAVATMLQAMTTRYILRFEPDPGPRPGLHALNVKLAHRSGTVHCRGSYVVGPIGVRP